MNNDTEDLDRLNLPKMSQKNVEEKDLIKTYFSEGFDDTAPVQNNSTLKKKVVVIVLMGGLLVFLSSSYFTSIASRFLSEGYMQEIARVTLVFFLVGLTVFFC